MGSMECVWENGVLIAKNGEDLKNWLLAQIIEAPSHINNFRITLDPIIDEDKSPEYQPIDVLESQIKILEQRVSFLRNTLEQIKQKVDKDSISSNPMDYVYSHQQIFVIAENALEEDNRFLDE